MLWLFAGEFGGIHLEGVRQLADRAPLGFRHVAGEGESYMGLFPRTVDKRFSGTRTGASWRNPSTASSTRARKREEAGCPVGIMRNLACLSGATRCGVDWYAFHGVAEADRPSYGLVYAGCWIWTSENFPSTHSGG